MPRSRPASATSSKPAHRAAELVEQARVASGYLIWGTLWAPSTCRQLAAGFLMARPTRLFALLQRLVERICLTDRTSAGIGGRNLNGASSIPNGSATWCRGSDFYEERTLLGLARRSKSPEFVQSCAPTLRGGAAGRQLLDLLLIISAIQCSRKEPRKHRHRASRRYRRREPPGPLQK